MKKKRQIDISRGKFSMDAPPKSLIPLNQEYVCTLISQYVREVNK